ncbi:hypothetical protein [Olleya namhaensis]|uniref:hypothetical protein n=1 Tax=Olleya namhaensis TaxID=1144750 RepID=UPI00249375F1|nr:hypothetical protein [Olleya namhaensis]
MDLPPTTVITMFSDDFKGRNPGDLGEDMRALTLPTGATRNNTGGNAPAREGDCP